MVAELQIIEDYLPEYMVRGDVFILENAGEAGDPEDPYWALLACPECGTLGLITRKQVRGYARIVCGSETCPACFTVGPSSSVIVHEPN